MVAVPLGEDGVPVNLTVCPSAISFAGPGANKVLGVIINPGAACLQQPKVTESMRLVHR